jgi:hypothetical protein
MQESIAPDQDRASILGLGVQWLCCVAADARHGLRQHSLPSAGINGIGYKASFHD